MYVVSTNLLVCQCASVAHHYSYDGRHCACWWTLTRFTLFATATGHYHCKTGAGSFDSSVKTNCKEDLSLFGVVNKYRLGFKVMTLSLLIMIAQCTQFVLCAFALNANPQKAVLRTTSVSTKCSCLVLATEVVEEFLHTICTMSARTVCVSMQGDCQHVKGGSVRRDSRGLVAKLC